MIRPIGNYSKFHNRVIQKCKWALLSKISQVNRLDILTLFSEQYKHTIAIDISHKRHNNVRCHKNTHDNFEQ